MEQFNSSNQNHQPTSSENSETLLFSTLETIALRLEKMERQINTLDRNLGNLYSRIGEWNVQPDQNRYEIQQRQQSFTSDRMQELLLILNRVKDSPQKKDLENFEQQTLSRLLEISEYLQQLPTADAEINLDSLERGIIRLDSRLSSLEKTVKSVLNWKTLMGMGSVGAIAGGLIVILGMHFFPFQPNKGELDRSNSKLFDRIAKIEQYLNVK